MHFLVWVGEFIRKEIILLLKTTWKDSIFEKYFIRKLFFRL